MKIIETQNRKALCEGRNTGIGFGFLQRKGATYSTVNALSPCKDFLNEVVFTENTGLPTEIYGLSYPEKKNIFKSRAYMAIKVLPVGTNYFYGKSLEIDQENLKKNHKNIEAFLRHFEEQLGMSKYTVITEANDGYFLVRIPLEWVNSTISISLYTLLLRTALVYDGSTNPIDYLKDYNYNKQDKGLINNTLPKLQKILEQKKLPEQPKFNEASVKSKSWMPHNVGIVSAQI